MQKLTTLILAICFLSIFLGLMPVHGESEIYDSVVRFHVIANSDSEEDQALKLKVRDAVLKDSENLFSECKTKEEAIVVVNENMERIKSVAQNTVYEEGYDYTVSIEFGKEEYPTKNYESFCFPSGEYLSLKIMIGESDGENWWCVLFPPMCLSAASASKNEDAFISVGLSKDQYGIITETDSPTYKVRFKILEVIEENIR